MLQERKYYWCVLFVNIVFFLNIGFRFQPTFCNGYHDKLKMSININSIAILIIHGCIINRISKSESTDLLKMMI